jgi:hypothetical protein
MSILDRVAREGLRNQFRPTTARDLFILRLAQKLGEPFAIEHYIELAAEHSDETLVLAFRRTFSHTRPPRDVGRQFHVELVAAREQHNHIKTGRLLAVKVERRSVAVAVFVNNALDFHDVRQLSSQADKAETTAIGFLNWVIGNFDIESAALERMANGNQIRRAVLNEAIIGMLRNVAIPVWEVNKSHLLEAYGYPPLRSRLELRQAAKAILWSMFNSDKPNNQEIDAATLGLHVQTERLFLY